MNTTKTFSLGAGSLALLSILAVGVQADTTVTPTITYSAGIEPNKAYENSSYGYITGNGNGNPKYDEYDVFDFATTATPGVTSVSDFTINLFDEGYASNDTVGGGISFYVEPDTTTSDNSPAYTANPGALTFDASQPNGVDVGTSNGFTTAPILIGTSTLVAPAATTPNYEYSFSFTPSAAVSTYLASQLATGGPLRILATPNSASDAIDADIFGFKNSAGGSAPSLSLVTSSSVPGTPPSGATAVPEASSYALLALGLLPLGLLARRRFSAQA
jgi:hypothetical protein